MNYQPLSVARQLGLPNDWLQRYNELPAEQRRVLYVDQVVPGTDAEGKLYSGDVVPVSYTHLTLPTILLV